MNTAPNTAPATAPPSLGSSSEPITVLLFDLNSDPMMESMTIANSDMTTHDHAFIADTTGFTILAVSWMCFALEEESGGLSAALAAAAAAAAKLRAGRSIE